MVDRAFVVSGMIALAGCPSKKEAEHQARETVVTFNAFVERMCACKDKACANKVQDDMARWFTTLAAETSAPRRRDKEGVDSTMKAMTALGQVYGECKTKALAPPYDAFPPPGDNDSDVLLQSARIWARATAPTYRLWSAQFSFIDVYGKVDRERGYINLEFGGPPGQIDCFALSWTPRGGWVRIPYGACHETVDRANQCSVKQVWSRAIEDGASYNGLATLSFTTTGPWSFIPTRDPVETDTWKQLDDDCTPAVQL